MIKGLGPFLQPNGFAKRSLPSSRANRDRMSMRTRSSSLAAEEVSIFLADGLGKKVSKKSASGGSDWATMYTYECEDGSKYFCKVAKGRGPAMFEGEKASLDALGVSGALAIPKVYSVGVLGGSSPPGGAGLRSASAGSGSYILMDYLDFGGRLDMEEFGRRMAEMHLAPPLHPEAKDGKFGFPVNNTIGATPQPNPWTSDWIEFFKEHRIRHQLRLANDARLTALGEQLVAKMDRLFEGAGDIRPSILHGDLWSGNIACVQGRPSVYDPAAYYGHHEAEWGMDWCAGLTSDFWKGYRSLIPKAPGFEDRHELYTLYHILNHYNLFGGGYHGQSVRIMERLLAKLQ